MTVASKLLTAACLLSITLTSTAQMSEGRDCGNPFDNGDRFGPYDYTDANWTNELQLVEVAHFTAYQQELALNGVTSLKPQLSEDRGGGPDQVVSQNLNYTLYAFPNHHKALYAMAVWQLRVRADSPERFRAWVDGANVLPAECYFLRAITYKDDGLVRQAYGAFLHRARDLRRAEAQYQASLQMMPDLAEAHYNLGLLYVDLKQYQKAQEHATRAYELGYPLQGLRRRLDRLRKGSTN